MAPYELALGDIGKEDCQNQAQGGTALCYDWLGVSRKFKLASMLPDGCLGDLQVTRELKVIVSFLKVESDKTNKSRKKDC